MKLAKLPNYFMHSYKRFGVFLFIVTTLIAIPFTLSILARQQDNRSRAQEANSEQSGINQQGGEEGNPSNGIYCPGIGIINATTCPAGTQQTSNPQQQTTTNTGNQSQITGQNCAVDPQELALDPEEQKFITLLNQYRQSLGLQPLTSSATLSQMAAWMANDTTTNHYIAHEPDSLGRSRLQRSGDCGMSQPNLNSEVIDAGFGLNYDAAASLRDFEGEPAHDALLKQGNLQQIGVARKIGPNGSVVWVVDMQSYADGTTAPTITATPTPAVTATPTLTPTPPVTTVTQASYCPCVTQFHTFACGETSAHYCSPGGTVYMCTADGWVQNSSAACIGDLGTNMQPTLTPTITQSPQIGFYFTVKMPGIGSNTADGENNNPILTSKILQVAMFDPNDPTKNIANPLASINYNQSDSSFEGGVAAAGTYNVKVRTDNSLWNDLGILTVSSGSGQVTKVPTTTLITGDINQDNVLNLQDYTLLISCYGTKTCPFKPTSDLNQDGKINDIDLNIFYSGLANRQGD